MIQHQAVQEVLAAWREAERQLEAAHDPAVIIELRRRIEQFRGDYRALVGDASIEVDAGPGGWLGARPETT
jgi:hypothetical protein